MEIPQISIIMATYNRQQFILESLLSIQNQTYTNFECLIIDDGGTDKTLENITSLLQRDSRFTYHKRNNKYLKGLPGTRNCGLDFAKGTYIIFFDDDDIVHPQNLEICVKELKQSNIDFCRYLRTAFINKFDYNFDLTKSFTKFNIDKNNIQAIIKDELPLNSCAVMWKKKCFFENRFVENLMYAEEWELYTRIISKGFKGISINKVLFFGRKHQKSNTGEFYNNDPIRRESKSNAIILIIKSLNENKLLSNHILKYFISTSIDFKEFRLFNNILKLIDLSIFNTLKWKIYYHSYCFRAPIYKIRKQYLKL